MKNKLLIRTLLQRVVSITSALLAMASVLGAKAHAAAVGNGEELTQINADLSLADAFKVAEKYDNEIAVAQAEQLSSHAATSKAKAVVQPGVSTNTYVSTGSESSIVASSPGVAPGGIFLLPRNSFVDQNITAMIPLSTGGLLRNRRESASAGESAANFGISAALLSLKAQVTASYVNVLLQRALLVSAESKVATEQEQVRITQTMVNVGRVAPLDLLREQAELADSESSETQSQIASELAMVDLKGTLGISQLSTISLSDSLDALATAFQTANPKTLTEALSRAESNSPELAAVNQEMIAAKSNMNAVRGENAPQVYAIGMADTAANTGESGQTGYTVGITASIPVYDGGARHDDIDSAAATFQIAEADVREEEVQIQRAASKAWFEVLSTSVETLSAQAGLDAAQQGYDLANLRYNSGKSTTADRLAALEALTKAQSLLDQAKADEIDRQSALTLALGK